MPSTKTVADVMTRDVTTLFESESLNLAREKFALHPHHQMPVVANEMLVGMVSQRDILRAAVFPAEQFWQPLSKDMSVLDRTLVGDVMHTNVTTAVQDEALTAVLLRMLACGLSALPVVDKKGRLLGVISERDLLRVVALLAS